MSFGFGLWVALSGPRLRNCDYALLQRQQGEWGIWRVLLHYQGVTDQAKPMLHSGEKGGAKDSGWR